MAVPAPNFFVVGAPKCGTTSIYAYLAQHPGVFMPRVKEPNFFADDLEIRSYPELRTLAGYLSLYQDGGDRAVRGDGSQFHLYSRTAAGNIGRFAPDAKIAILLREPVSMMASLHAQYQKTGDEDVGDFAAAVALEEERRAGRSVPERTLFPRCMAYLDVATFSPQVKRYLDCFDREAVKIILLDDLRRDTAAVYRDLLRFLDLPEADLPDLTPRNAAEVEAAMPPALEATLRRRFAPEIDRLELLLGRDLSAWR